MEVGKLLFTLACILSISVMGTISSADGAMDGMNCSAGSAVLDCEVGGHILLTEVTLDQQGNQHQTSSLDNGSQQTCSTSSSLLKSLASSCNGQEQCPIQSIDELSNTCGDMSQLTLHFICLPGPVYNPCSSAQITMTRSAGTAFVITPHYPFSYPRDSDSVQSSCTIEVLIPAGQTIQVTNYQSNLPTGTVLGVCGNSVHIALPKTVIDSTYCTEMDEIMEFTGDFQIRFYGTWTDKANGAILQIKEGALPKDQIASFTKCLRKDSQSTTMSNDSQHTTDSLKTDGANSTVTMTTTMEMNNSGGDTTDGSTTSPVPNTSKDFVSSPSTVTVQNPSPTRIFVPSTTLLETLDTKTEDNALFGELSTPHIINIDSDANSVQSTESEIVSFTTQSTSDDINDDVSEITTTHNSVILSEETITQTGHDTTLEPLTRSSEEALSDVSKTVFTTLNPRIEEITDSSQADQSSASSLDTSTIDPQSPEPETSTSIVSRSSTANSDDINITYQRNSMQNLVTETFQGTTEVLNHPTSPVDGGGQSPVVTTQGVSTTKDKVTEAVTEEIEETTTNSFKITTENTENVSTDTSVTVESVTSLNHPGQSDTSSSGDSASTSPSSHFTSIESNGIYETTESSISGTSQGNTEVINTDGAKTTKTDDAHASTENTQQDHTESQSIRQDSEDTEPNTTTTKQSQWSGNGTTQGTTTVPEVQDTSATGTVLISSPSDNNDVNASQVPFEDLKEDTMSTTTSTANTAGDLPTNSSMFPTQTPSHVPEGNTSTISTDQLIPLTNLTTKSPPESTSNSRVTQTPAQANYRPDSTEVILTENHTPFNTDSHKKITLGNLNSTRGTLTDKMDGDGSSTIAPASYPNNSHPSETTSDSPSLLSSTPILLPTVTSQQSHSPETGGGPSTIRNVGRTRRIESTTATSGITTTSTDTTDTISTTAVKNDGIIDGFNNSTSRFPITNTAKSTTTSSSKGLIPTAHANTTKEDTNSLHSTTVTMEESSLGLFGSTTQGDGDANEMSTQNPDLNHTPMLSGGGVVGSGNLTDNGKNATRESVTSAPPHITVSTTVTTEQGTQNDRRGFSEVTTVSPSRNVTETTQTRNTTMEWAHNADINKTTTTTFQPANSTGAVTVPNGSVLLGEKTSNVGIIIAGVLVGLVITFAIFNLCLVIIKLKRKNRRHCFFLRRDNNMNKKASKACVDSISKLGPYDAYNADNSANITNIMPPPSAEQDTAALIGLNIANGRVHSISIGGSNPRPSNGNICHSRSDRAPTTSTFRPSEEEDLASITRTIPNIHYISSNELFQPPDFVPFSDSRTNLVLQDRYSDIDENSLYSENSNDDSGYPKNSGSHIDQFLNSYTPKSKDFYLSNSGTLYPRSKPQSPCGTNEPPPNYKPNEKIEKFPFSHSVALPSTDGMTKPPNNTSHAGGQSTQHILPNHCKFNIAQNTTETRV